MQVHRIARQGDADEVAHIDSETLRRMNDMHVICLYRKIQFVGFIQYVLAQASSG